MKQTVTVLLIVESPNRSTAYCRAIAWTLHEVSETLSPYVAVNNHVFIQESILQNNTLYHPQLRTKFD